MHVAVPEQARKDRESAPEPVPAPAVLDRRALAPAASTGEAAAPDRAGAALGVFAHLRLADAAAVELRLDDLDRGRFHSRPVGGDAVQQLLGAGFAHVLSNSFQVE